MEMATAADRHAVSRMVEPLRLNLGIVVRHAAEPDLRSLEWFGQYASHRDIIRAAFDRQLLGDLDMLVADLNGFPIGQVWVDYRQDHAADGISFWAVRVMPPLRRLGIGEFLMRAAEAAARERGATVTSLTVERRNTDARRFYERLGYRVVDPPPVYDVAGRFSARNEKLLLTQWLMRKRLRAAKEQGHEGAGP